MATAERTITGYHEAGHVVLGWMFGIGVLSVSINPIDNSQGRTIYFYSDEQRLSIANGDKMALKVMALVGLGGMAADAVHHMRTGRIETVMTGDQGDR